MNATESTSPFRVAVLISGGGTTLRNFIEKIKAQVAENVAKRSTVSSMASRTRSIATTQDDNDFIRLPSSLEDAIRIVLKTDLEEYNDLKLYKIRLESYNLNDRLERLLPVDSSSNDTTTRSKILLWNPYYVSEDNGFIGKR